jgi:hypothetical protein
MTTQWFRGKRRWEVLGDPTVERELKDLLEQLLKGAGGNGPIWRVSPPPTPPHNVADLSELVIASSSAATLRGGGHAPTRERLRFL